jgi:DNA/RNA-binding domain of Phe-tRNA-synthetase-like protein
MRGVTNPRHHTELEQRKRAVESQLRTQFAGQSKADVGALPTMQAYRTYYKRFKKTYHVLLQLRSVALEDKPIPSVAALVETMFISELQNGLLTAGHDLDKVVAPITLDVAKGHEQFTALNGREPTQKTGDMIMTDAEGVICSVIYGSDRRTAIGPSTNQVLFIVYAPAGIDAIKVRQHLQDIRENVLIVSPEAVTQELHVYSSED